MSGRAADDPPGRWTLEAALGGAYSVRTPLMIDQDGAPELRFTARWRTRAFDPPLYHAWRVARERGDRAWAVELVHHKLHLDDPPPEIERYEITHGFNLLTINRLALPGPWLAGAGLGVVIARPESRVRGRELNGDRGLFGLGYDLAGPVVALTGGARRRLGASWFAGVEAKLTAAYARVPVAGGWSSAPNVAAHALVTLGWVREDARAIVAPAPAAPPRERPDQPRFEP